MMTLNCHKLQCLSSSDKPVLQVKVLGLELMDSSLLINETLFVAILQHVIYSAGCGAGLNCHKNGQCINVMRCVLTKNVDHEC